MEMRLSACGLKVMIVPLYAGDFFKLKDEAALIGVKLLSNSLCFSCRRLPYLQKQSQSPPKAGNSRRKNAEYSTWMIYGKMLTSGPKVILKFLFFLTFHHLFRLFFNIFTDLFWARTASRSILINQERRAAGVIINLRLMDYGLI